MVNNPQWHHCLLGDLLTFHRGFDLPKSKMIPGPYPVVGSNGIIGFHNTYSTEGPSITIGRSGNVGNPFIYFGKTWSHNTTLFVEKFNCDPIFAYYLLKTLPLSKYAGGSAVPTLNRNHIKDIKVFIPKSLDEQRAIGINLKKFDDKIEINNKIIDLIERICQLKFNKISDSNTLSRTAKISDLGTVVGGATPSKSRSDYFTRKGIAWITPKDLSNNKSKYIYSGGIDITKEGYDSCSAKLLPLGSILFSSRAPIGYIAIAGKELSTNQGFKSVVPKPEFGTPFVYFLLKSNLERIISFSSGSTFKEISGSVMKSIPLTIPEDSQIKAFNEFCSNLFELQKNLELQNSDLRNLQNILLPKLLAGEISVNIK